MGNDRYDCIVIGAGPAGSSAALTMARENMSVLLLERGDAPGSKKLFAGTIHRAPTDEILPAFWQEAPLERPVVSDELWLMDNTSAVKIGFTGLNYGAPPYNKFTVLRYKWDNWLAQQAVKAGAHLRTRALVRRLLFEADGLIKKRIVGVELDSGEKIYSHIVIIAEGCSANLTGQAGLRSPIKPEHLSHQVFEILYLPSGIIEERFNLEKGQGAVVGMIGYPNSGTIGKGGLWLQKDSVALTVGSLLNQMITGGLSPYQLLARLKAHPLIKRLLHGAETIEYGSHTIPKGGFTALADLFSDGLMITGDAAGFISGRRGADLAMFSGKYAAETAAQAKAQGNYSSGELKTYDSKIRQSFFYQDMRKAQGGPRYFRRFSDSDYLLSKTANELAYEFFRVGLESESQKVDKMKYEAQSIQPYRKSLTDLYQGIQHWGVF